MPKSNRASVKRNIIPFHKDFVEPSTVQRKAALGIFPIGESKSNGSRKVMLVNSAARQPSLQVLSLAKGPAPGTGDDIDVRLALSDINEKHLFIPTPRSETSFAVPKPRDELDWLAQVPEEGQTFDEYLTFLTTRTTGRVKPIANSDGLDVLLLPIIRSNDRSCVQWPKSGPSLDKLVEYTKIFFDRQVQVLPAAQLRVSGGNSSSNNSSNNKGHSKKKRKVSSKPGAFASASKCKFTLSLPGDTSTGNTCVNVAGRIDISSDRIQLQVASVLDELSAYRYNRHNTNEKDFCVMGITMEDLFDGPSDLFCAGMAFGGDKVAVFSFKRYHPLIKMHPLHWHHYGYTSTDKGDGYSYYDDDDQDPEGLSHNPPSGNLEEQMVIEFLRRSCKLLTHELGHLYGVDHCIHNRCLMIGTGHLVQDFSAPTHLCGVCLRKLQWRLGFSVKTRYKLLSNQFANMGMEKEGKWANKQYEHLEMDS